MPVFGPPCIVYVLRNLSTLIRVVLAIHVGFVFETLKSCLTDKRIVTC